MAKNSRRVAVGRMTMTTGLGLRLWGSQLAWVSNDPSKSTTSAQAGGGSPNGDETGQKPGRRTPATWGGTVIPPLPFVRIAMEALPR